MKTIITLTLALATTAALSAPGHHPVSHVAPVARPKATPAPPPALPVFEFKDETTETDSNIAGRSGCSHKPNGVWSCYGYDTVAGLRVFLGRSYYNNRLYSVVASFDQDGLQTIRDALVAKYGAPAAMETRKWQSRGGASFDNQVAIWRFKGGALELESMGAKVGQSVFAFSSALNSPPAEAPKVDF
jgi:hypothetical protein